MIRGEDNLGVKKDALRCPFRAKTKYGSGRGIPPLRMISYAVTGRQAADGWDISETGLGFFSRALVELIHGFWANPAAENPSRFLPYATA